MKPYMYEIVEWFQKKYPKLVLEMWNSTHHNTETKDVNPYHIEGDVWCHSMMVCKQAEDCNLNVKLAALLHDIGKPLTRNVNPKNDHVSFFSHEPMSAFMALDILKDFEKDFNIKLNIPRIFTLIALHTEPFKLEIDQLNKLMVNMPITYLDLQDLSEADKTGRFYSGEKESKISGVEYLSKSIKNDYTKNVTLLCGLPCSGKSTYRLQNEFDFIISRDELIEEFGQGDNYNEKWKNVSQRSIDRKLQAKFREAGNYNNICIDMTHMSKKSRRKSLTQFGKEYQKNCVIFIPPLSVIYERNENRTGKHIGQSVYEKMIKSFYVPTYYEFDTIDWRF